MPLSRRSFLCGLGTSALASPSPWQTVRLRAERGGKPPTLLNRNENPYGPSAIVTAAMEAALKVSNRYPAAAYQAAVQQIAGFHGLKSSQLLLGCGSTDVMRMCSQAFLSPHRKLITAEPTFDVLEAYARSIGAQVMRVPLTHRHEHNLDGMLAHAGTSTSLIYVCNPNNPTGTITPKAKIEALLSKLPADIHLIIDEAYHHYAESSSDYASFLERASTDSRLIVLRTFSIVYGLAGLRVGYAVATEDTISRLAQYRLWSGVNVLATHICGIALKDKAYVELTVRRNRDDRQEFFNQAQIRSLKPLDSHTNFYFMNVGRPARSVIDHFHKHHIEIGPEFPSMNTFLRVTIGLPSEMHAFWRVWDLLPRGKMMM